MPNYLTESEVNSLFDNFVLDDFYNVRNYLIFELIYSCGFRLSEVVSVKISNINLSDKQIKVIGKGKKERMVCFGDYAKEVLLLYLNKYIGKYKSCGNDYLFITKKGNAISTNMVHQIIKKEALKVGIKRSVSAHSLRHSFATSLINNGASIDTVKELLGHSSLSTTQIYTHVTNDKIKSVYKNAHPRN